jgi:hypothetical protein
VRPSQNRTKIYPPVLIQYVLVMNKKIIRARSWAHTCNPSCSGGRDEKDCGSKPAQANSSQDPISKTPFTHKKRAGRMTQGVFTP